MVMGHGAKGRWHKAKLETLEDPTVVPMLHGKTFPNLGHTLYVLHMCDGATLTRSGHFLGMRHIGKKIMPNIQVA